MAASQLTAPPGKQLYNSELYAKIWRGAPQVLFIEVGRGSKRSDPVFGNSLLMYEEEFYIIANISQLPGAQYTAFPTTKAVLSSLVDSM